MNIKNMKWLVGASSLVLLGVASLQGCSDSGIVDLDTGDAGDTSAPAPTAGAAGKSSTPTAGSGGASVGAAGDDGAGQAGAAGGNGEPLTQAELCETFCTDEFRICTGDLQQYEDLEACAAACNQFARGSEGDMAGDTLDCRIYHLHAADTVSATTHCPHTAAVATAACVN